MNFNLDPENDKEINNTNIFGKLLPDKKFWKILLRISLATVQDYWMIKLVVYLTETDWNTFKHNVRKQFHFRQTTTDNQNISGNSAEDTNNKI